MTTFKEIYDCFLGKITDDMYLEWTEENTYADLKNILLDSLPAFEFPKFALYDYNLDLNRYNIDLTKEEINIIAISMYNTWLQRQIASVENTRMKYSGADFKMTSQANHLDKLIKLKQEAERQFLHAQRLYCRRIQDNKGTVISNWSTLMERSALDG